MCNEYMNAFALPCLCITTFRLFPNSCYLLTERNKFSASLTTYKYYCASLFCPLGDELFAISIWYKPFFCLLLTLWWRECLSHIQFLQWDMTQQLGPRGNIRKSSQRCILGPPKKLHTVMTNRLSLSLSTVLLWSTIKSSNKCTQ